MHEIFSIINTTKLKICIHWKSALTDDKIRVFKKRVISFRLHSNWYKILFFFSLCHHPPSDLSNHYSFILRLRPLKEILVVTSQRLTWIINNKNPTLWLTYYTITNITERRSWNYINLSTGFRLCVWMRAHAHPHTKTETNRALQFKL